jgi:hypothetical protein
MDADEEIFGVTDRWGDEIALTRRDWDRLTAKRPGIEGYVEHVRETLERPSLVYGGRYEDSKVFYRKGLLDDDSLYRACYVAVIVRYPGGDEGATIRTVCFPFHLQGSSGGCFMPSSEPGTPVTFVLDGRSLVSDYDEDADVLYLWAEGPRPAVTFETKHGHLVQLDPESREFVGVAIVDYRAQWEGKEIAIEIPTVEERVLQLV